MTRKSYRTLKHGHGVLHDPHFCRWLEGPNAHPDWPKYETVQLGPKAARARRRCSYCLGPRGED